MKKKKAQDLSTAEREQIAQEFMFKINQAAEDDEEAVQNGRPALNKLKMLKVGTCVTRWCCFLVDLSSSAPTEGLHDGIGPHKWFFVDPHLGFGPFLAR